ncbi:MAG: long-chain fatty acid--CoA ligase [Fibrobacteres bacterium]|nr:long-chain fatty acid--CoA ligase [Fibrobacterota bacterium]
MIEFFSLGIRPYTTEMFFGYCHTAQFLTHTRLGGQVIIYDQALFTAKHFCSLVKKHKITCFTAVPTILFVIDQYRNLKAKEMFSLRYICFGGGVPNLNVIKSLLSKLPSVGFVHTYGQTECSPRVTALLPSAPKEKFGSVGKTIPNVEVTIRDENDKALESNQIGQVCVRGENITLGYYKRIEETEKLLRGGWLHTGDLGYLDSDNYLWLKGRLKTMIIKGGLKVYPEEVEQVILRNPKISQALVKPLADDIYGEVPICQIVLVENESINTEEIKYMLNQELAEYKHPVKIEIVKILSLTATNKLKRY